MLRSSNLIIAGVVAAFCVSSALAVPVVDGTVSAGEYDIIVNDASGETTEDFYNTGLDIDNMQFEEDGGWAYMALTVVSEPIDTNGDPTSLLLETYLAVMFYSDDAGASPSYYLEVVMRGSNVNVELMHFNGTNWQDVTLGAGDYDVAVNNALELRLSDSIFNTDDASSFAARLDGDGGWDDDQMDHNPIPEPATLTLLGLGGIGVLIRRRQK